MNVQVNEPNDGVVKVDVSLRTQIQLGVQGFVQRMRTNTSITDLRIGFHRHEPTHYNDQRLVLFLLQYISSDHVRKLTLERARHGTTDAAVAGIVQQFLSYCRRRKQTITDFRVRCIHNLQVKPLLKLFRAKHNQGLEIRNHHWRLSD